MKNDDVCGAFADDRELLGENGYSWCLHCERTYVKGKYRPLVSGFDNFVFKMCPYDDCDGDTVLDAWEWKRVREGREERYPAVPEEGKVYPLYE